MFGQFFFMESQLGLEQFDAALDGLGFEFDQFAGEVLEALIERVTFFGFGSGELGYKDHRLIFGFPDAEFDLITFGVVEQVCQKFRNLEGFEDLPFVERPIGPFEFFEQGEQFWTMLADEVESGCFPLFGEAGKRGSFRRRDGRT